MNPTRNETPNVSVAPQVELSISVADLLHAVWQRRCFVVLIGTIGFIAVGLMMWCTPNQYQSTATLMPPDQATISGISTLSMLGGSGTILPSISGSLMSARTPGQTVIGILGSRTVQDDLIDRFDLRNVYKVKLYMEARERLTKRTVMMEDKKTGLLSISVLDTDAGRSQALAAGYVEELNKQLGKVSASSARRERIFLEDRLKAMKSDLDVTAQQFSQFSSRNVALDPQAQGQSTLAATQRLIAELRMAQTEFSGLKTVYSDESTKMRTAQARIDELQRQLGKVSGQSGAAAAGAAGGNEYVPSLRELPMLGVTYYDLYRRMTMQAAIYEALSKQYEMAKVQEAKEVGSVKVLDEPVVAEKKALPHRLTNTLIGGFLFTFVGIVWVVAGKLWESLDEAHPVKLAGKAILKAKAH